ncbi:MAG: hypothetical protein IKR23_00165 [Lachnospiraceae bacterium]|nr:hypothetical protein [Lachnospiraceae bacterium]
MSKKKKKNNSKASYANKQRKNAAPGKEAASIALQSESIKETEKAAVKENASLKEDASVKEDASAKDTSAKAAPVKEAPKKAAPKKSPGKSKAAADRGIDSHHIMHPVVSYIYILVLFVLLIAVFLLKLKADRDLKEANSLNEQLKTAILTASENIAQLSQENTEQKKQLEAMSLALNARTEIDETQKKEEEESSVPELYPVKGDAIVVTPTGTAGNEDPEEENLLKFNMYDGSYAIATGNGVIEIMSDGGDGFINIVIDHGNGYKTSYTGEGISLKEAGDEIKRGDAVMTFSGGNNEFTYSISLNGKTVDPLSVMVIDG